MRQLMRPRPWLRKPRKKDCASHVDFRVMSWLTAPIAAASGHRMDLAGMEMAGEATIPSAAGAAVAGGAASLLGVGAAGAATTGSQVAT